jgi:hypothetical protein
MAAPWTNVPSHDQYFVLVTGANRHVIPRSNLGNILCHVTNSLAAVLASPSVIV